MKHRYLPTCLILLMLASCAGSQDTEAEFLSTEDMINAPTPQTPVHERIASSLQEAMQQYDDGHYAMSMRLAQSVLALMQANGYTPQEQSICHNLMGFSLLQLARIDDYWVSGHGRQEGAITRFQRALAIRDNDLRANHGMSLALFRRHGDHLAKADKLAQGILSLGQIREDVRLGLEGGQDSRARLRDALFDVRTYQANREELIRLGFVFRDTSTVRLTETRNAELAPWLGTVAEAEGTLLANDMRWILEEATQGGEVSDADHARLFEAVDLLTESWLQVQHYWRARGLKDLQESRDRAVAIHRRRPDYLWIDRDLVFFYQSLGAFFLDLGLEKTRRMAIEQGQRGEEIERAAQRIYLSDEFESREKRLSAANYRDALKFLRSFMPKHREVERMRMERQADVRAGIENETENPFLVDLGVRFGDTMAELISEERDMRYRMVLEGAAMCIDPLYQINDLPQANIWAEELRALQPRNALHHFVRATAHFRSEDYETAAREYRAFLDTSSIAENEYRRRLARSRILVAEDRIRRSAGAGESTPR
jgi:tetratricopeptide (TPR) repeat protein